MSEIVLYPSNWLYNAGVVGFLYSLEMVENKKSESYLSNMGTVSIPDNLFSDLECDSRYFSDNKIASIVGKSTLYRNFLQSSQKDLFKSFVKALKNVGSGDICNLCGNGKWLQNSDVQQLNSQDPAKNINTKFIYRIQNFSIVHNSLLGPSLNEFPNAFWGLTRGAVVCHLCSFIIIHHHLAMTRLSDGSEIFINAPSFKVMYYLNKFAREAFGTSSSEEARTKREILAMSVIEYATKIQTTLGVWTGMNIEIITKRAKEIQFFSLPYEVVQILSDRRIASILSRIGEFTILNLVINQDFSRLIELGYRLFRIGLKSYEKRGDSENKFVNHNLRMDKNRRDLQYVAGEIFKLCALIEEKLKKGETYDVCIY